MISESATAETTAPPSPCTARAATSMPWLVASPHVIEASVKSVTPPRNMRRCPNRSPSRPPRSRKPPNVSRYALTTHASDVSEKPRSSRIDGSATFTIVVSSTIIRSPRHRTNSASQRVRVSSALIRKSFRVGSGRVDDAAFAELIGPAADESPRYRSDLRMPPPSRGRSPSTIHGPIARADLPGLCDRVCALLHEGRPDVAYCEVDGVEPDAVTVDALARLQLAARRCSCQVRLRGASDELRSLVAFMGLADVLTD